MTKVALMQPYLFPYIGYFQLIHAVDTFIAYDDVQWMKGGWINHNRILVDGRPEYITLPVKQDSHTKNINEREFSANFEADKQAILAKLTESYANAPYFEPALKVVERCFADKNPDAAVFIVNSLRVCCEYMGIKTTIIMSSDIADKTDGLRAQDRVIDTVKRVGATHYINAIGGQDLYSKSAFAEHAMELSFIKSDLTEYEQFGDAFVPGLSIIDIMMFNSQEDTTRILESFELV